MKPRMPKNNLVSVIVVLAAVCLSCTLLKDKFADTGGAGPPSSTVTDTLQNFDINAPRVFPGEVAIRRLAQLDPTLATFKSSVQESESAAMKKMIAALQTDTNVRTSINISPVRKSGSHAALMMFQAGDASLPGGHDGALVGMLVGGMK